MTARSLYEFIGGEATFKSLVEHFYGYVERDALLRPLFPADFTDVRERQYWFLTQLFGGPRLYEKHRGSPMLKHRHLPHPITVQHADAWLECMKKALRDTGIDGDASQSILNQLTKTAYHMVNTFPKGHGELPIKPEE